MASATSISEKRKTWTRRLQAVGETYGVVVHLVEIVGKRWSYLAGPTDADTPMLVVARRAVDAHIGTIVYADTPVDDDTLDAVADELQNLVAQHE